MGQDEGEDSFVQVRCGFTKARYCGRSDKHRPARAFCGVKRVWQDACIGYPYLWRWSMAAMVRASAEAKVCSSWLPYFARAEFLPSSGEFRQTIQSDVKLDVEPLFESAQNR